MKKFYIPIIALSVLLISISCIYIKEITKGDEANVIQAFKALETEDFYEEIYFFCSLPKNSNEKVESLWGNVLTYFDMRTNNPIISYGKDGIEKEERQTDNGKVFVDFSKTDRKDFYSLSVNINTSDNSINLLDSMAFLEKNFSDLNLKYEVTLSIKGSKLGKLNNEDIFNIKSKLISKCNANIVSEYDKKDLYSVTAFSKYMGRYVRVGGKKVNLSIAVRYSETDNKTYIYLATPVIRTEI